MVLFMLCFAAMTDSYHRLVVCSQWIQCSDIAHCRPIVLLFHALLSCFLLNQWTLFALNRKRVSRLSESGKVTSGMTWLLTVYIHYLYKLRCHCVDTFHALPSCLRDQHVFRRCGCVMVWHNNVTLTALNSVKTGKSSGISWENSRLNCGNIFKTKKKLVDKW